tara:strand:- start:836 stop:1780 length:945 start_codon:yes stop_codon:yes gene_type:complete
MDKYVIKPEKHELWKFYKQHVASFWTLEEIDLSDDANDWNTLTVNEQHFIKTILAFFAAADGIVNENLAINFYKEVEIAEARAFYSFQIAMETIHAETYSALLEFFIVEKEEQYQLFSAIENMPVIKDKAEWTFRYLRDDIPFAKRLVAFACVEGILFSGSFCAIFWLKKRGIMKGLTFSNELISRDEGLHTEFACALYKHLELSLPENDIHDIVKEAVELETKFICYCLPCELIGMNSGLMSQYIQFVADRLLNSLNCNQLFNVPNPFDWMELISLQGKTNFFERRVGEYQKAGVMNSLNDEHRTNFSLTEDF